MQLLKSEPTSTTVSAQYVTTNTNRRRLTDASPEDELKADCMVLAGQLLSYLHVSIVEYPAFRNLVSDDESVCDGKYKNVHQVQADPATGTCTVQLTQHWMMRGLMSTDIPAVDYIAEQIQSYDFSDSGTTHFFTQSYLDASQTGIECKDKGGKSGKASSNSSKGSKTKEEGTDLD